MSLLEFPVEVERIRYPEIDLSSEVGSIEKEVSIDDDHVFVAVGKEVKENKSTVIWALQNSGGKKIWILHVHTPAQMIPFMGGKIPVKQVGKQEVMAYHEQERNRMHKALDDYVQLCAKAGVIAQKLFIEADSIENGIIRLISENMIGRLVMGAAADNRYKKSMTQLKSKKAIYVQSRAPAFCHIWFVCKGYLIYTREGVKSRHVEVGVYKHDADECSTPRMSYGSSPDSAPLSRISVSDSARPSASSVRGSPLSQRRSLLVLESSPLDEEYQETRMGDELYDKLDKLMLEADSSREEAYLESIKRRKAEKETIEATRKVQAIESLYSEEKKRKKEVEEKLKMELETIKNLHAKVLEEFGSVLVEKSSLEREIEKSNLVVEELDDKIFSAVGLLDKYRKERDELDTQLDNAMRQNEVLRRQLAWSDPQVSSFFADFTYSEILEATDNFNPSWKIGEGGFGDTYRGLLRHTQVAVKLLSPDGMQGPQEFQQEVDTLSKLRHPNIVTLIGVCSEASSLIYEYLPNGSLDERLACKDNTPPLSWQARIRVAAELCCALMFLHSQSIIHRDLKPANILLDAHFSCKLSDFGICRTVHTRLHTTDPKGTFAYMDPEYLSSGELTPKSDVYSLGIILLRLMTGKSALGIVEQVQSAVDKGTLDQVLDPSAGDWPFVQAKQLALLGLRCCEMQRINRPDLEADVWRLLDPMRVSCGSSASPSLGPDEHHYVPSYFVCPIFQEVMQDPHIAADGFTYEAEALKGWLDSGHDTSPMTNLKLDNHILIPNRALRSAIQECLTHPPST